MKTHPIELTVFSKTGGPLTKRIGLAPDGTVVSDGSACLMAQGHACRVGIANMAEFGILIEMLKPYQAIALGQLRPDLPDQVEVTTKAKLNGGPGIIARTGQDIVFHPAEHALVLFDHDRKGMPAAVAATVRQHGGFWPALVTVLPDLADVARLTRASTSAGLYHGETGAELPGSEGAHVYIVATDGSDANRFLRALHDRCWLAGMGWYMLGAAGQLLDRSIVDRMVGGAERLVFEGGPLLDPPVRQHGECRKPVVTSGEALETMAACPPLTIAETCRLQEIKAKAAYALKGECERVQRAFIVRQTKKLVERTGVSEAVATRTIERQIAGVLWPDIVLPFDDPELAGCTVRDVLADPDRFVGETLADPLEGVDYGRCVAKILRRENGSLLIHSFAHGRTIYDLKLDVAAVRAAMERVPEGEVVAVFVRQAIAADLDPTELEVLRQLAHERSKIGLRVINNTLKAAQQQQAEQDAKATRARQAAQRRDPRPQMREPFDDEPWLPLMKALEDIVGVVVALRPPPRDIDDDASQVRKLPLPDIHAFSEEEGDDDD
jgi:hypothetical protein